MILLGKHISDWKNRFRWSSKSVFPTKSVFQMDRPLVCFVFLFTVPYKRMKFEATPDLFFHANCDIHPNAWFELSSTPVAVTLLELLTDNWSSLQIGKWEGGTVKLLLWMFHSTSIHSRTDLLNYLCIESKIRNCKPRVTATGEIDSSNQALGWMSQFAWKNKSGAASYFVRL